MATDMEKLRAEITNDPEGLGYAGKTDAEVLGLLLAENRPRLGPLEHGLLIRTLAGGGRLAKIQRAASAWADDTKDTTTSVAMVALGFFNQADSGLDPSQAADVALVNALVSTGTLSSDDRTALVDAATQTVSRATELGLGLVRLGYVQKARA